MLILSTEAGAVQKQVKIGGAYSVNDLGQSDNRISMDNLKEDYSFFKQTDWLTEYFHKDTGLPNKVDQGEALSWLIDNGIVSRDETVSITNIYPASTTQDKAIPKVNIKKLDLSNYTSSYVGRSDLLMYLYKAVFGPIDARTIAIEIPNMRVDNVSSELHTATGQTNTLRKIMDLHGYYDTIANPTDSVSVQTDGNGYKSHQNSTDLLNTSSRWRYTPQGDEYESIFGDTNIFVSDVNVNQQSNAGIGTQNNGYNRNEAYSSGSTNQSGTGSPSLSQGDDSVATGGSSSIVMNYESDYKQIYYVPGSDIIFYRTNDCLELYLQYAMAKGLLTDDDVIRQQKFNDIFVNSYSTDTSNLHVWSPNATPFLVNRKDSVVNKDLSNIRTTSDPIYANTLFATNADKVTNVLGENYLIHYEAGSPASVQIRRLNLFNSNTGYFDSETISRMQFYKYIFKFLNGNEKKLSDLEVEIINYKYGMQLDSLGSPEEVYILKYLIALGILDYTRNYDFQNLNNSINWGDFLTIIYRIANPKARLDFSKVQLTDSESQWQASGYTASKLSLTDSPQPKISIISSDVGDTARANIRESSVSNIGRYVRKEPNSGIFITTFADSNDEVAGTSTNMNLGTVQQFNLNFSLKGGYVNPSDGGATASKKLYDYSKVLKGGAGASFKYQGSSDSYFFHILEYYLIQMASDKNFMEGLSNPNKTDNVTSAYYDKYTKQLGDTLNNNSISYVDKNKAVKKLDKVSYVNLCRNMCNNAYVIALFKSGQLSVSQVSTYFDEIRTTNEMSPFKTYIEGRYRTNQDSIKKAFDDLLSHIEQLFNNNGGVEFGSFTFTLNDGSTYQSIAAIGGGDTCEGLRKFVSKFKKIEFSYASNGNTVLPVYIQTKETVKDKNNLDSVDVDKVCEVGDKISCDVVCLESEGTNSQLNASSSAARNTSSLDALDANAVGNSLDIYSAEDGSGEFIAWSEVQKFSDQLHISRVSDSILYNTVTDTYAYFPDESNVQHKYALVGSSIVNGSPQDGVITMIDGKIYYWLEAIKLLASMQGELAFFNTVAGIQAPQQSVVMHAQDLPVESSDGIVHYKLNGIRLRMNRFSNSEIENLPVNFQRYLTSQKAWVAPEDTEDVDFANDGAEAGWRWGNYIAAATSNRALNMVSRKIVVPYGSSPNDKKIAYAMVFLMADEISSSSKISKTSSMQDILDFIAREPTDVEGKSSYVYNKDLCNDLLNWIYNTSGIEYINTGYLKPQAFIYVEDGNESSPIKLSDVGPVTPSIEANVKIGGLKKVTGRVDKCGDEKTEPAGEYNYNNCEDYDAEYYISDDYKIATIAGRLMIHEAYIPNISGFMGVDSTDNSTVKYCFKAVNRAASIPSFSIGRQFKLDGFTSVKIFDYLETPVATVMEIKSDGTIRCQYGPFYGVPTMIGGKPSVINLRALENNGDIGYSSTINDAINSIRVNSLKYADEKIIGVKGGINWDGKSIYKSPALSTSQTGYAIWDGEGLDIFEAVNSKGNSKRITLTSMGCSGGSTVQEYIDSLGKLLSDNLALNNFKDIETYIDISFNAYDFSLVGGVLKESATTVSDIFSHSLFAGTNDMIVDEMIYNSEAAIPINEVPENGIIQIGTGMYIAGNGDDMDKSFVGFAPLNNTSGRMVNPTVTDVAYSFASEFIRGGNTYVNISHFMNDIVVLNSKPSGESAYKTWDSKLNLLSEQVMNGTSMTSPIKNVILSSGDKVIPIYTGNKPTSSVIFNYAPVLLKFNNNLKAYLIDNKNSDYPIYKVCNIAQNATSGALDRVPLYTPAKMKATLSDHTSNVISGGFAPFSGARNLLTAFKNQFNKTFAQDIFTLVRMLVFIVLVWLFVVSWICYAFHASRLMPIVDAICHPTNDKGAKGVDLFKIFSFGTISVDSDFKLGRFIQYDIILAVLLLVVWKSGNITL